MRTEFLTDHARSIISENDSADVGFRYSLNPYRGCEHGCVYCYARPTHEYLGFDAGLDFETKIVVKQDAATLFRDWLNRPDWDADVIAFSGVTDCYQPAERRFKLTRACLEVAVEARQPLGIVTKNALVCRDLAGRRFLATAADDDALLEELEQNDQVVLRYASGANPNGSVADIAGVSNADSNVMGLMPHPEHAVRALRGGEDGAAILGSLVDSARARAVALAPA